MKNPKELFKEDQEDRRQLREGLATWDYIEPRDQERLAAAQDIVAKGHSDLSAQDLWCLSYIFHHSDTAQDSLIAHELAKSAYKKGHINALEMVCLTFDRYQKRIKNLQVYGTQYKLNSQGLKVYHPINHSLTDQELLNQGLPSRKMYKKYLSSILDQKSISTLIQAGLDDQESSLKHFTWEVREKLRRKNQKLLMSFIQKFGWPTTTVDKEASWSAWLIAQHCDFDLDFQTKCLNLLAVEYKKGQVNPLNYAYLYDRVMVNSGKKQLFATQWSSETELCATARIKDLAKRRKKVGLLPFLLSKKLRKNSLAPKELSSLWQLQEKNRVGRFANSML